MNKAFFLTISMIMALSGALTQESLMLGEHKAEDIQTDIRIDGVIKSLVFGYKYNKKNIYKDSVLSGIYDYSEKGELLVRTLFGGKKNQSTQKTTYKYDENSNVTSIDFQASGPKGGVNGRSADFFYDGNDKLIRQVISLANINYEYYPDGRIKKKVYTYNNRSDSAPWIILFQYDSSKNLIHVADDTTKIPQTSFYNEKNELIRHDYYPGFGISFYEYDERGNCTKQVDYELGKKDWDSTVYEFQYDFENRLIVSSSSKKKGRVSMDRKWIYNDKGQLEQEILYRKNKARRVFKYYYEYPKV